MGSSKVVLKKKMSGCCFPVNLQNLRKDSFKLKKSFPEARLRGLAAFIGKVGEDEFGLHVGRHSCTK
ncbi:hypothetical protein CMV_008967 [Castanea mollissima]|uniref:Uncharacterized protein n=1 Tax=Castanea mollissima TaxID=60419 RepID=A0A8J4VRE9_9ROSI|nr:hypothetical protein CMV_008967 [Castanea mollissima]